MSFSARRPWLPGALAALAFTAWLVLYYGYQLDYPYFEAPGYGIATMANRAWHWDQPTIRLGLTAACIVLLGLVLSWTVRVPKRVQQATMLLACAVALTWMLAGEITSSRGAAIASKNYVAPHCRSPRLDRPKTDQAGATFLGQNLSTLARSLSTCGVLEPVGEAHLVARRHRSRRRDRR